MSPLSAKSRSSSLMNSSSYSVSPTKPQYCFILLFGLITISRPLVKTSRFSVPSFVRRLLGIRRPSSTITASIMIRSYCVLFTLMICGLWGFVRWTIDTIRKVTGRHTTCTNHSHLVLLPPCQRPQAQRPCPHGWAWPSGRLRTGSDPQARARPHLPSPPTPDFCRLLPRRPRHAPARQRALSSMRTRALPRVGGRLAPQVSSNDSNSCNGGYNDPHFRENPGNP
jgi:hypothetical protein